MTSGTAAPPTGRIYSGRVAKHRSNPAGRADLARRIARGAGEVLITFGLIVLLFAVYEVYGKGAIVNAHQHDLDSQLNQTWNQPQAGPTGTGGNGPVEPAPGSAFGRLYIPVLHKHWVIVEGVSLHDIEFAPGHYPGTALPGQVGNFSVAGHRITSIFWNLNEVRKGDQLVVQTRNYWYVYTVTVNEIVTPHSIEVIAPTPDQPAVKPTKAMMTLTTCNPKWDNYQRMVVHAELTKKTSVKAGPPVALGS